MFEIKQVKFDEDASNADIKLIDAILYQNDMEDNERSFNNVCLHDVRIRKPNTFSQIGSLYINDMNDRVLNGLPEEKRFAVTRASNHYNNIARSTMLPLLMNRFGEYGGFSYIFNSLLGCNDMEKYINIDVDISSLMNKDQWCEIHYVAKFMNI